MNEKIREKMKNECFDFEDAYWGLRKERDSLIDEAREIIDDITNQEDYIKSCEDLTIEISKLKKSGENG